MDICNSFVFSCIIEWSAKNKRNIIAFQMKWFLQKEIIEKKLFSSSETGNSMAKINVNCYIVILLVLSVSYDYSTKFMIRH